MLRRLLRQRAFEPAGPAAELAARIAEGSEQALEEALALSREEQAAVAFALAHRNVQRDSGAVDHGHWVSREALSRLLRRTLPWTDGQLAQLIEHMLKHQRGWLDLFVPLGPLVGTIERQAADHPISRALTDAARDLAKRLGRNAYAENAKLAARLRTAIGEGGNERPERRDRWAAALEGADPDAERIAALAAAATQAKPTRQFRAQAAALREEIGAERLGEAAAAMLAAALAVKAEESVPPDTGDLLRGLAFITAEAGTDTAARAAGDLAIRGYRKIPNFGPLCAKAANAALNALAQMDAGAPHLARARSALRQPSAMKKVEEAIDAAAARLGVSRDEFEEIVVPDYGLRPDGTLERRLGDHTARITADHQLRFRRADGRELKTAPKAVKEQHGDELAELKALVKDIRTMSTAHAHRLERLLAVDRTWTYATWRERYLDHGLIGPLARRLIWRVGSLAGARSVVAPEGELVDVDRKPVEPPGDDAKVRLWHPIGAETDEVRAWRRALEEWEVQQPFKQAHREIYLLTDAERETGTYSNRFAAHVLRQHQLAALCRDRGWRYSLQGGWDSFNEPTLELPQWGLRVAFWLEPPDYVDGVTANEMGIFLYVLSDQVRFLDLQSNEPVPLMDVPRLAFTEAMRDVDLFVGVCSVGNDPTWRDQEAARDHLDYWNSFAFGELGAHAEVRRDVLERLLPKLRIRDVASVEGRYLVVRGTRRTYKIHLGSANILMEPDDAYLCIVHDRTSGERVWLPFEGDATLALILSKAFLLADDDKITDPAILSQIKRR